MFIEAAIKQTAGHLVLWSYEFSAKATEIVKLKSFREAA
jgi:hypothetical protein